MSSLTIESLDQVLQKIAPIAEEYAPEPLLAYKELVKEKTESTTPHILIYGMYSHGKSTLINALLGEEAAKMAKKPTTSACDKYPWKNGGCVLIDSPGIEAQQDHSAIAVAKREQCELVAMVVESSSFEHELVWKSIVELVQGGQQVCLLINGFDGLLEDVERCAKTIDAFRVRLQNTSRKLNYANPSDIVSKVKVEVVNAKRALLGRVQEKGPLVEKSSIKKVEVLLGELVNSFNIADVTNTLKRNLHELIVKCKYAVAQKSGNDLLAEAEDSFNKITLEREYVLLDVEHALDDSIARSTNTLKSMLAVDNPSQENIEHSLEIIAQSIGDEISEVVKYRLQKAEKNIAGFCADFQNFKLESNNASYAIDMESGEAQNVNFVDGIDWSNTLKGIDWESTVTSGIESMLKVCKNWFPNIMKGKGPVWMSKTAAAASKVLGAAASVAAVAWSIWSEYKAQKDAQDAAMRRAEAIADTVRDIKAMLRITFMVQLTAGIDDIFDKILPPLKKSVNELRKQCQAENAQDSILLEADAMLGYK